VIGVTVVSRT